jgi:hypothetical protein
VIKPGAWGVAAVPGSSCGCGCCAGWLAHTWRKGELGGGAPGAGRRDEVAERGMSPSGTQTDKGRQCGGRGKRRRRGRRRGRAVAGGAATWARRVHVSTTQFVHLSTWLLPWTLCQKAGRSPIWKTPNSNSSILLSRT